MIVCIAEKPSVAREIANVLGAFEKKDGYIQGNGYQVTWTFGHLCMLKEPGDYNEKWKAWSLFNLPMIPSRFGIKLIDQPSYKKQFEIIKQLMREAEQIINCGDAGQEGELIQRWVIQMTGAKCPVKRLWISSLTEEAIKEGFEKLKDESEFQSLYEAGLSRAIGDWELGMNATRVYSQKFGSGRQVLSVGRVQTPTLALIVNRQLEIENFKPEPFWELKTVYRDTTFSAVKGKFASVEQGNEFLETVIGKDFIITDVSAKKGVEYAPRLFDLTSLQVEGNKKFAFSADETLKTVQSLYEKKFSTYPRVDTTFLSDDIYPKCPGILKGLRDYADIIAPLNLDKLPKSKKVFDSVKVTDHHAIIPTGVSPQGLTDAERKIFDLIARRFIAVFYPDCKVSTTTVLGGVEQVEFKVTGKQILEPGWRSVFAKQSADEEQEGDDERVLPLFVQGESGPHAPVLHEKYTQPPKLYTEATLLRAMETAGKLVDDDELRDALKENGIGRPSTRAAIIETLFKRGYIRKEKKNLLATSTGVGLIQVIHEELLKSAELTGQWEKKLRGIEKKSYQAAQFLGELKQMVTEIVQSVVMDSSNRRIVVTQPTKEEAVKPKVVKPREKKGDVKKDVAEAAGGVSAAIASSPAGVVSAAPTGKVCPLCGGVVIKGKAAYGCSNWRSGCSYREPF